MASETGLIPKEIVDLLNYRVSQEEASSRLYYDMYEWLDNKAYSGAAKMVKGWSDEEMEHAGWARRFLEAYNYIPEVNAIPAPKRSYTSLKQVMELALQHEKEVTEQCNDLTVKASDLGAFHVMPLALQYVNEQVDEMQKTYGWVDRLTLVGDDPAGIMLIDQEMGA